MRTALEKPSAPIAKTPGVQGGKACVSNTRIPVFVIVNWKKQGWSDSDILNEYADLSRSDLKAAWTYYDRHKSEIDADIEGNERWIRDEPA